MRIERLVCVFSFLQKGGSATETAISGKFKLEISGRPVSRTAVNSIKELITPKVMKIDKDVQTEIRTFSDLGIVVVWTGVPKNLGNAQSLIDALKTRVEKYFQKWEFHFNIELIETGR